MRYFNPAFMLFLLCSTIAMTQEKPRPVKWNNPDGPKIAGIEHKSFKSKSMEVEIGYCVYTPPGYATSKGRFPVVYFLHGSGGNENSDAGGFSSFLAKAIKKGTIPPVICVFPNGGLSGYRDRPTSKIMGETSIIKELIPLIDSEYRTQANREGRVVAGFSMGGGGAVRLALKHPDLFSVAASWAGAFRAGDGKSGSENAASLAESNIEKVKGKLRILLVVGDKDFTYAGHKPLLEKFKKLGVNHEMKLLEGVGHDLGAYHRKTSDEFVEFLARDLKFPEK